MLSDFAHPNLLELVRYSETCCREHCPGTSPYLQRSLAPDALTHCPRTNPYLQRSLAPDPLTHRKEEGILEERLFEHHGYEADQGENVAIVKERSDTEALQDLPTSHASNVVIKIKLLLGLNHWKPAERCIKNKGLINHRKPA